MLYTNDRFQRKEEQKVCKRSVIVSARCIAESFQRSSKAQDGSAAPAPPSAILRYGAVATLLLRSRCDKLVEEGLCDSDNELADLINSQTGSGVSRRPKRIRDKTKKSRKFRDKHCGPLPGYGPPSPHCL